MLLPSTANRSTMSFARSTSPPIRNATILPSIPKSKSFSRYFLSMSTEWACAHCWNTANGSSMSTADHDAPMTSRASPAAPRTAIGLLLAARRGSGWRGQAARYAAAERATLKLLDVSETACSCSRCRKRAARSSCSRSFPLAPRFGAERRAAARRDGSASRLRARVAWTSASFGPAAATSVRRAARLLGEFQDMGPRRHRGACRADIDGRARARLIRGLGWGVVRSPASQRGGRRRVVRGVRIHARSRRDRGHEATLHPTRDKPR